MPKSPAVARLRSNKFDSVIGKKKVEEETKKVDEKLPISNVVLGLLVFVLVGNFFMQFLQTLNTAGGTGGAAPEE